MCKIKCKRMPPPRKFNPKIGFLHLLPMTKGVQSRKSFEPFFPSCVDQPLTLKWETSPQVGQLVSHLSFGKNISQLTLPFPNPPLHVKGPFDSKKYAFLVSLLISAKPRVKNNSKEDLNQGCKLTFRQRLSFVVPRLGKRSRKKGREKPRIGQIMAQIKGTQGRLK